MKKEHKQWVEKVIEQESSKSDMMKKLYEDGVEENIVQQCSKYYDKLKKKKPKKQKPLFENFFNKNRLQKTNRIAVVYLRDNGLVDFKEVISKDGEFSVEGEKYHEDRDCVYTTQKDRIPLAIIREWDLIPLGTKKWYDTEGRDEKMRENFAKLERHVLRGIKNIELYKGSSSRGNLSTKQIVLWIIIAFVIGAIVIGYL